MVVDTTFYCCDVFIWCHRNGALERDFARSAGRKSHQLLAGAWNSAIK